MEEPDGSPLYTFGRLFNSLILESTTFLVPTLAASVLSPEYVVSVAFASYITATIIRLAVWRLPTNAQLDINRTLGVVSVIAASAVYVVLGCTALFVAEGDDLGMAFSGALVLSGITIIGVQYFRVPEEEPEDSTTES